MSAKVEKIEKNKVKIEITVEAKLFDEAVTMAFKKNANKFNIPGFRKGKAPRKEIEKHYGEAVMYEEAFDIVAGKAYEEALDTNDIYPVDRPDVDIKQIGNGQDLIFTAEVIVKPELKLEKYKGIEVEKIVYNTSDEDVNAELEAMRAKNARTIPVEDRALQEGDISNIDFEGFVDGVAFEGGKGENFDLTIGSGQFIPGFEEQLVGMNLNETREISVKFPDEYHSKDLAGKDSIFKVTLNGIKVKEMPELDDEFVKDVSEFDTIDELKADIKKKLEDKNVAKAKMETEEAILKALVKDIDIEIPEVMIKNEANHLIQDFEWKLKMQGLDLKSYLTMLKVDPKEFQSNFEEQAIERIKTHLAIEEIVKAEKVEITEDDMKAKIKKLADTYGEEADHFEKHLRHEDLNYMKEEAKFEKVIDILVANSIQVEKKEKKAATKKTAAKKTVVKKEEAKEETAVTEEKPKRGRKKAVKKEDAE